MNACINNNPACLMAGWRKGPASLKAAEFVVAELDLVAEPARAGLDVRAPATSATEGLAAVED
jgi:hypothetical protein